MSQFKYRDGEGRIWSAGIDAESSFSGSIAIAYCSHCGATLGHGKDRDEAAENAKKCLCRCEKAEQARHRP